MVLLMTILFALGIAGQEAGAAAASDPGKKTVVKFAHVLSNTSHYQLGAVKFAELVKAKTNGRLEVEVHANAILGGERDMIEGMQLGTMEIGIVSTAPVGQFSPRMMAFDLPFLFRDSAHAWKVADGPIGTEMFADLQKKGIVGLAYWENGFRHVFVKSREITKPSDIKGMKIRTMENPVHSASFKAMEAIPTPLAWGELYTALQQGTVDGAENALVTIYTSRFNEVAKYTALTGHFYGIAPLLMSKKVYDRLPDEFKKAISEAAIEGRDYQRKATQDLEKDVISKLTQAGMTVSQVDRKAFQEKCKVVYEQFKSQVPPETVKRILETK
jgi:tripartite ATP-independent transporter DctP family solute receptor